MSMGAPNWQTEGCRRLDFPYPPDVAYVYCAGHGALPTPFDPNASHCMPTRCDHCNGTGKAQA